MNLENKKVYQFLIEDMHTLQHTDSIISIIIMN